MALLTSSLMKQLNYSADEVRASLMLDRSRAESTLLRYVAAKGHVEWGAAACMSLLILDRLASPAKGPFAAWISLVSCRLDLSSLLRAVLKGLCLAAPHARPEPRARANRTSCAAKFVSSWWLYRKHSKAGTQGRSALLVLYRFNLHVAKKAFSDARRTAHKDLEDLSADSVKIDQVAAPLTPHTSHLRRCPGVVSRLARQNQSALAIQTAAPCG